MILHVEKCVTLKCYRAHSPIRTEYFMNTHRLENINNILFGSDNAMSFIPHIDNIVSKATKVLNFIKHNLCKCSTISKSKAYVSLVRPILEYVSSSLIHITVIPFILSKRTKEELCTGSWMTIVCIVACLQCCMKQCQQRTRLSLLYKSIHNLISLYLFHHITSLIPIRLGSTTIIHLSILVEDAYMNSFFLRTVKEWNTLRLASKYNWLQWSFYIILIKLINFNS